MKALAALAGALDRAGIGYMVIGGQAVLLYGEPRLTRDVDLTLALPPESVPELIVAIAALGWDPVPERPREFAARTLVLPVAQAASGLRADLIFSLSPYERQAIARGRRIALPEGEVSFASPEDVIIHKLVASRPRDLEDVRGILLKQTALDFDYIRRWLAEFESATLEPLSHRFTALWDEARGTRGA